MLLTVERVVRATVLVVRAVVTIHAVVVSESAPVVRTVVLDNACPNAPVALDHVPAHVHLIVMVDVVARAEEIVPIGEPDVGAAGITVAILVLVRVIEVVTVHVLAVVVMPVVVPTLAGLSVVPMAAVVVVEDAEEHHVFPLIVIVSVNLMVVLADVEVVTLVVVLLVVGRVHPVVLVPPTVTRSVIRGLAL